MKKYNLDKLVKVRVIDFYPSVWCKFIEGKEKKYFWQTETKEGIYSCYINLKYLGDKDLKNHTIINGIVYENPEVELSFEGDVSTKKYFLTLDEAQLFANKLTKGKNWLLN